MQVSSSSEAELLRKKVISWEIFQNKPEQRLRQGRANGPTVPGIQRVKSQKLHFVMLLWTGFFFEL